MKKLLTNLLVLFCLISYCLSFTACSQDPKPVSAYQEVENIIETIKDIQFSDIWEIENVEGAQNAYNALSEDEKAKLSNYSILKEKVRMLPYMKQCATMVIASLKYFRDSLRDPYSIIIEADSPVYMHTGKIYSENQSQYLSMLTCVIKVTYNAKNGFGGYTGASTAYINYWSEGHISLDSSSIYESFFKGKPFFYFTDQYSPESNMDSNEYDARGEAVIPKSMVEDIIAGKYDKFA